MEFWINIDIQWFKAIHKGLANPAFDVLMPILRDKYVWIPLYLIFVFLLIKKYKWQAWIPFLGVVAAVICADQFSAGLIKEWAQRLRPCNEPSLSALIRPIVPCGSGYSFISSHATNHFALAVFFSWLFSSTSNWKPYHWIFYVWAFSICFAQVYVGVHYPFDVILGAIAGLLIGRILLYLTKYFLNKSLN